MLNTQVVGCPRVYAKTAAQFTYAAWIEAIKAGRTFVTTGPMLDLRVGKHEIGDTLAAEKGQRLPVTAKVRSFTPVDRIEIVCNGEVIAATENVDQKREVAIRAEIAPEKSGWIAARAYSDELLPYQVWRALDTAGIPLIAHTSPVYIDVDGKPRRSSDDAAFFLKWCDRAIEWARTEARFQNDEERDEMIRLFQQAREVYAAQID